MESGLFNAAREVVRQYCESGGRIREEDELEIYALGQQAVEGDIRTYRPGLRMKEELRLWLAWNSKQGMSKEEAKQQFLQIVRNVLPPEWSQSIS